MRISHTKYRSTKHVIGSVVVEFDSEGVAEADVETAKSVAAIPGFSVLREPVAEAEVPHSFEAIVAQDEKQSEPDGMIALTVGESTPSAASPDGQAADGAVFEPNSKSRKHERKRR